MKKCTDDFLQPTVLGIGYVGLDYDRKTDRNLYCRWNTLLSRCYNPNAINYNMYGGNGVTVSPEWHNFSNFKKWFLDNIYDIGNERICVDKDILYKNNKIYSHDTCLLVPISFNSLIAGQSEYDNKTNKTNYSAITKMDNSTYKLEIFRTSFSNFKTAENAHATKNAILKALINGLVQNYPTMPDKVKNAILNYQF